MRNFDIRITGEGTAEEISAALLAMAGRFDNATEDELEDAEWEDETLTAAICEIHTV